MIFKEWRARLRIGRRYWNDIVPVAHPGRPSSGFLQVCTMVLAPIVKLCHRPRLEGIEHLPHQGPFLLVANHSAGMGLAEILSFIVTWLEQAGPSRPLAGFLLPSDFTVPGLASLARSIGGIPSTREAARSTLAAGIPIMIFPGGDYESLTPVWRANQVDFGGRLGYLRIAREAGVPVVPMGIRGGAFTAPILLRSSLLASLLVFPRLWGIKRWGLSALGLAGAALLLCASSLPWPLTLALAWLWLGSPLVFLPWVPWTIRLRIGPPLGQEELFGIGKSPDHPGESHYREASDRVQSAVRALVEKS